MNLVFPELGTYGIFALQSTQPAVLRTSKLDIGYKVRRTTKAVLGNLNLELQPGALTCLLGANGSGKTTLLRTLAGMQPALAGVITLNETRLDKLKPLDLARQLSVVLTERLDLTRTTGYDLVGLGRTPYTGWDGALSPDDHHWIGWALGMTGAEKLADRYITDLSDGERQRLLVARALAQRPRVMLLDEPTAFLDAPRRAELTALLRMLAHESQLAILLSTHDVELALRMADTIWLVLPGEGVVAGSPGDLALNGTLERAFSREGVRFDALSGGFRVDTDSKSAPRPVAYVVGTGARASFTAQTLEREGYHVSVTGTLPQRLHDPSVMVVVCGDLDWTISLEAPMTLYSLAELAEVVRMLHRRANA